MDLCACVQSFLVCLLPMNKSVSPSIYVLRLNPEKTSSGGHWRFVFTSSETHSESASVLGGKTPENDPAIVKTAQTLHYKHAKKKAVIEGTIKNKKKYKFNELQ